MKEFVKVLSKESVALQYLRDVFPKLSEAKVKAGVFVSLQRKKVIECEEFPKMINETEKRAWNSFDVVVSVFFFGKSQSWKLCGIS